MSLFNALRLTGALKKREDNGGNEDQAKVTPAKSGDRIWKHKRVKSGYRRQAETLDKKDRARETEYGTVHSAGCWNFIIAGSAPSLINALWWMISAPGPAHTKNPCDWLAFFLEPVPTGCLWSPQVLSTICRQSDTAEKSCWDKVIQKPNAPSKKSWLACVLRFFCFCFLFFFSPSPFVCPFNLSGFKIRAAESSGILGAKHKQPSFVLSSVRWISVNTEHIRRVILSLPLSFPYCCLIYELACLSRPSMSCGCVRSHSGVESLDAKDLNRGGGVIWLYCSAHCTEC